jgi:iron complex transport system substrate-binding protein
VQIRRGRATVTGDERSIEPLGVKAREGGAQGRPGSQETLGLSHTRRGTPRHTVLHARKMQEVHMLTQRRSSFLLSVFALAFLAASTGFAQGWPRTITDDMGASLRLAAKPQRIVSATLPTDEILFSLVSKSRLAAITGFAEDPNVSNVVSQALEVPAKLPQLNVEVVISLKPDLVFVADWTQAASVKQLRDAGLVVYQFKSPVSVAEIEGRIARIGGAVGEEEAAKKLVQWMETRLAAVAARVSTIPPDKRLTVMDYNTWSTSMGKGSSWDEIVRLAGLRNAVADLASDQYGSVALSKEMILTLDPDILMVPAWVYGDPKGSDTFYASIIGDPALKGLKAVRQGRVHRMAENIKGSTSQYIVLAVEDLARYAYPDLFK